MPEHRAGKGRESVQQLYLVGFSADRKSLHLSRSPGHRPDFRLEADGELTDLLAQREEDGDAVASSIDGSGVDVQAEAPAPGPDAPHGLGTRSRSRLSPREIQARLRTGLTVAEVAGEAGVDIAWVDRFAAPIMAEQAAALERACRLTLTSARKGVSAAPLGVALARNLEERGVRLSAESDPWSAHLHHDSTWVIRYSYRWRGRAMEAEWLADLSAGALGARNRLATELGWLDPDLDSPRPVPSVPTSAPSEVETPPVPRTARVAGAAAPTKRSRSGPGQGRRVAGAPAPSAPTASAPGASAKAASAKAVSAKAVSASTRTRRTGGASTDQSEPNSPNGSVAPTTGGCRTPCGAGAPTSSPPRSSWVCSAGPIPSADPGRRSHPPGKLEP
jgi:hypothetical protein